MTTTTPTAYLPVNCSRFQPGSTDNPYDVPALCLVDADQADKFSNRRLFTTPTGQVAWAQSSRADGQLLYLTQPIAEEVLGLMEHLNRNLGKTIVVVTHDPKAAHHARVQIHLEKGVLDRTVERHDFSPLPPLEA